MVPETTHSQPGGAPETQVDMAPGVPLDATAIESEANSLAAETRPVSAATHLRLDRMERTILHTRIAALEQALEAKDRQRTAIIDRYETIVADLERRTDDDAVAIEFDGDTVASQDGLLGSLHSLLERR